MFVVKSYRETPHVDAPQFIARWSGWGFLEKGETEKEEIIGVKMFESLCDTVLGIVERWIPKKKYSKEIEYRDELAEFIRNELKRRQQDILFGTPKKHRVKKEAGRSHADIEIDVNKLYRRLAQSLL